MNTKVSLDNVYIPSEGIVVREIHGEFIIVPIYSGAADMEDSLFSLNQSGRAIWDKLDTKRSLKDVVHALSLEFEAPVVEIEKDVLGLTEELLKKRIIVEAKRD